MIFGDSHCIILTRDDQEHDWTTYTEQACEEARRIGGYLVQVNSDPPLIFADYRRPDFGEVCAGRAAAILAMAAEDKAAGRIGEARSVEDLHGWGKVGGYFTRAGVPDRNGDIAARTMFDAITEAVDNALRG
jgi:hypothetical protein